MSYAPDTNVGYVPPPPPARTGKSPWFYVGMGCLTLFVLVFGGCIIAGVQMKNLVESEMKKPLSPQQALAPFEAAQVPIYPKAKLDITMTKTMRSASKIGTSFAGAFGQKIGLDLIALNLSDSSESVLSWYDAKLKQNGWTAVAKATIDTTRNRANVTGQKQYKKGKNQLVVQTQSSGGGELLLLSLVSGVPDSGN